MELSVRNGTMTNFEVDFLASPMDGSSPHIHQITNFRSLDHMIMKTQSDYKR
jgi:hypothetical protein